MEIESKNNDLDLDVFIKSCLENVSQVMKNANSLPITDYEYWSIDKCFQKTVGQQSSRMINMIQYILTNHGFKNKLSEVSGVDDEDSLACVTSICDQLLERINTNLDKASGKKPSPGLMLVSKQDTPHDMKSSILTADEFIKNKMSLMTQKSIPKPQSAFKEPVDNSDQIFKPRLTTKPHAIQPLEDSLRIQNGEFCHPYAVELEMLQFDSQLLQQVDNEPPLPLEDTPFTYIDTKEQLQVSVDKLLQVSEVAVDLEHHSFRSYQGFTCLMQLSTRHEDFIIDTIALRHHMHTLNTVFTHPQIVKVLHGCDSDVEWLQKDFGLYLVNCFDTGQAARLLQMPQLSLAYLLQVICNVTADKQFQKADWRIRKLPDIYLKYAREDTHYLLHIYDVLRNQLLQRRDSANNMETINCEQAGVEESKQNLVLQVFQNSKEICKKTYVKRVVNATSHVELYEKKLGRGGVTLSERSLEALKWLYAWRNKLARLEDESTGYILPDDVMLKIAQTLPVTDASILKCCKTHIPPTLKRELESVKMIISDVINLPITQIQEEKIEENACRDGVMKVNADSSQPYLPSFTQASFHHDDYDESALKLKGKINTALPSLCLSRKPGAKVREELIIRKLNKIFMPYMPEELLPKDYKKGNFKVKFMASQAVVEVQTGAKVVSPEEVVTNAEMNFSNKDVVLRNKIKGGKTKKSHIKVSEKEENSPSVESCILIDTNDSNNVDSTIAKSSTNNKKTKKAFVPKVYKKEELKGMVKVEQSKKRDKKKGVFDVNEELDNHPAPLKTKRSNFHKSNKSHSFMPNK